MPSSHPHNFIERHVGNPACTICEAEVTPEYARVYMDAIRDVEESMKPDHSPEIPPQ